MKRVALSLVVVVATAITAAVVIFDVATWARIPVVLAFAVVVPGLGWAWRLRLSDAGDALLLAVTISVCLLVIVGEGMALLRLWSMQGGFLVLAAIALFGIAVPRPQKRLAAGRDSITAARVVRGETLTDDVQRQRFWVSAE